MFVVFAVVVVVVVVCTEKRIGKYISARMISQLGCKSV